MTDRKDDAYLALRNHLNPIIKGGVTDAVLKAVAEFGTGYLIEQVEAVDAQAFIATAEGSFLDDKLAPYEILRPGEVGLSDEIFRNLGIEIKSAKQIRSLLNNILENIYGFEFSRATVDSVLGPYNLEDGDKLIVAFDGQSPLEINFRSDQFENINTATSLEVSDVISRALFNLGSEGSAVEKDNGAGGYVKIISPTTGPSSSIQILGGRAQNKLRFPQIRSTSAGVDTQWTFSRGTGGSMRMTWTGGADPKVGKARDTDYVNIYGSSFDVANQGTFQVKTTMGGLVNESYFEYYNPLGVEEIKVQGTDDAVLFFFPKKETLTTKSTFTGAFQTSHRLLQVYLPVITKVVRRGRIGAGHLQESGDLVEGQYGPHLFDPTQPYSISGTSTTLDQIVDAKSDFIIGVDDSGGFPDNVHKIVLGYGTDRQEGPVPVIQRPSNKTLFLDPSYKFKFVHPVGEDVTLIHAQNPLIPDKSGQDYQMFITDVVSGRLYAEQLIKFVQATGINLVFILLYPNDEGLGRWGTSNSEKVKVWGDNDY